jgi:alkaline phosphatase D
MKLQPLTVGPIVGATTGRNVRLWGRGELEKTLSGPRRCFGVARLRRSGGRFGQAKFFKMNPNFDMSGVVIFDRLRPKQHYFYQMGWFLSDVEMDQVPRSRDLEWDSLPTYEFTSASEDDAESRSFVFGSCRYLLRLFGGAWFDNRGDKTFRSILEQIGAGQRTDQIVMMGDQIYADDMGFISPDVSLDAYNQRYRDAFSQPYIGELLSRLPTYMTLDDHEIEDAWPARASTRDWVVKYPAAMHAYLTYQASYSPLFEVAGDRITGVPDWYWYIFRDGCCDFFVSDTRTERLLSDVEAEREIMSDEQLTALKGWLNDSSGRVKFVVSSVPVFPEVRSDNRDKWGGFTRQRSELLDFIRDNDIRRVVFLSGDVHSSLSAEVESPGAASGWKVVSIISSAFFWPYAHNRRHEFILNGEISSKYSDSVYRVTNASLVTPTDNFSRLIVDLDSVTVQVYSRKGELLTSRTHAF